MTQTGQIQLKILYQISGLTAPGLVMFSSCKNKAGYKVGKGIVFKTKYRLIFHILFPLA
jgi:hypothetical protein